MQFWSSVYSDNILSEFSGFSEYIALISQSILILSRVDFIGMITIYQWFNTGNKIFHNMMICYKQHANALYFKHVE